MREGYGLVELEERLMMSKDLPQPKETVRTYD